MSMSTKQSSRGGKGRCCRTGCRHCWGYQQNKVEGRKSRRSEDGAEVSDGLHEVVEAAIDPCCDNDPYGDAIAYRVSTEAPGDDAIAMGLLPEGVTVS